MPALPDWLQSDYTRLARQYHDQRLPHALLFVGAAGDGALLLLEQLLRLLMCTSTGEKPCGHCKSCQLMASGYHPDLIRLAPEGKGAVIKVDAIRRLSASFNETAQQAGNKIAHIVAAERMNPYAANALLKTLEEPTAQSFLLLQTPDISQLLPTLRSRCQLVYLTRPSQPQALAFVRDQVATEEPLKLLHMVAGEPIRAQHLTAEEIRDWVEVEQRFLTAESFSTLSRYVASLDISAVLEQILLWIDSALRLSNQLKLPLASVSPELLKSLQKHSPVFLFLFRDYIVTKMRALRQQANLNPQLMAEELVARWFRLRGLL